MSGNHVAEAESHGPIAQTAQTAVPLQSRYLTRSATRRGTANISHILQRAPATTRPSRTTKVSASISVPTSAQSKTRTPFIEALNRVAGPSDAPNAEASSSKPNHPRSYKQEPTHYVSTQNASPAKPLPLNRKRPSGGMLSSPRGLENSPNSRPRKVAKMPRLVGVGPSPLKSLVRYQQPTTRTDAPPMPQAVKVKSSTGPEIPTIQSEMNARGNTVSSSSINVKPNLFSPAKVPVGSQTPFRYGTNRILDVPLSAVKKGGRWSLASDLSDDSLLLAASPKKTVERPKTILSEISGMSVTQPGKEAEKDSNPLGETAKDLELLFLGEDVQEEVSVAETKSSQLEMPPLTRTLAKYTIEKSRKAIPQKTSAARIVHRAQKSLSLPRTTSSYANPTRSSTNAAAITAASIDARTSLKNAIKEPSRKPVSTPATQIAAPPPTVFARPCGIQSRTSTIQSSGAHSIPSKPSSALSSQPAQTLPAKSPVRPRSYIPISPIRERNANIPNEAHKPSTQGDAIELGRPISVVNNARRKSLTMETSKSLYGLSAALAKLTVKRPSLEGRSQDAEPSKLASSQIQSNATLQHSSTQPTKPVSISRIPQSTSIHGRSSLASLSAARGSLDAKEGSLGQSVALSLKGTRPISSVSNGNILKGVIAFVDVRTAEGDDTSAVFAEMLRSCGARVSEPQSRSACDTDLPGLQVLTKPTESCTHIIFKSGKISTLIWWRKQPEPKPHMVGIGWVTKSRDTGERVQETGFEVDVAAQAVFQKVSIDHQYLNRMTDCRDAPRGESLWSQGSYTLSWVHRSSLSVRRLPEVNVTTLTAIFHRIDNRLPESSQCGTCSTNVDALWAYLVPYLIKP